MALGRIAVLNPELFAEITAKAAATYEEQGGDTSFALQTLRNVGSTTMTAEDGDTIRSKVWIERKPGPEED